MSAVLKDFRASNMSLYAVKRILVNMYDEQTAMEHLKDYCLEVPTPEAKHHGLELFIMNGFDQEFYTLLNINKQSLDEEDRTWGKLYEINCKWRNYQLSSTDVLLELNNIPILTEEQRCFSYLLKFYCHYHMRRYGMLAYLNEQITESLNRMQPSIMKELFELRRKEILFRNHWRKNELVIARKYGFSIVNNSEISPARIARLHGCLALSYLYDGYDQSIYHLHEALNITRENNLSNMEEMMLQHNLPFISAYYGITEGIETDDLAEQAHQAIARGDSEKAITTLSSFERLTSFQKYYLGVAKMDKKLLVESYNSFINEDGHYFYAKLPLQALNKMNVEGRK